MTRSGYVEDAEYFNLYRGSVERAIKGKRGQIFLRDMAEAMDAMPVKLLIADELVTEQGEVCALGSVCVARGLDASKIYYDDPQSVGDALGISRSMAAEIEYINDEWGETRWGRGKEESPKERWIRVRKWIDANFIALE